MSISGGGVTFVTNANELAAKFGRLAEKIEDPRPVLESVKRILNAQEEQVWATEGGALGVTWKAAVQPERKVSSGLLMASGNLRRAMGEQGAIRGATLRISPRKLYYGFFHQFGTATMDARPFSGISDESMRLIVQEFQNFTERDLGV